MSWKHFYVLNQLNNLKRKECYEKEVLWRDLSEDLQDSLKRSGCTENTLLTLTICRYKSTKPKAPNRHMKYLEK